MYVITERNQPWELDTLSTNTHKGYNDQAGTIRSPDFPRYPSQPTVIAYLLVNLDSGHIFVEFTDLDIKPGMLEVGEKSLMRL